MNKEDISNLLRDISADIKSINIDELKKSATKLKNESEQSDFWKDNQKASNTMQKLAGINDKINSWGKLLNEINDLVELAELNDDSLQADIQKQYSDLSQQYNRKHSELAYAGPYDENSAVLDIHAGAGGTDAQDWAQMLLRMYVRWAETNNYKTVVLDESPGEEAGIKSASLEVTGPLAFGKLKGEHGVHRLVRLSPFNAQNLRQTSFAKIEVLPEIDKPEDLPIDEKDLKIDVFRAGGHGGQSVNTTDSAVRVTHLPTNIVISIQNERSQIQNKETALKILRSKLAQLKLEQHGEKLSELKGPNKSAEWGSQIRSYVLHPYNMVKDLRTNHETSNTQAVLDGDLTDFIDSYASFSLK